MKKVLAIVLAIAMIAVFVPAFAVNAADAAPSYADAIDGKHKLNAYSKPHDSAEDYIDSEMGTQLNGLGCGFIDGNVYFSKATAKTLFSALETEDVIAYVDGKVAGLAPKHSFIKTDGVGGGFLFAIYGASVKAGTPAKITLVFGETGYYTEFTITPSNTLIGYDSANVEIKGSKAVVTVTGADIAANYKVGDSAKVRVHDDHTDRTLTVVSVTGNTVVFETETFKSTSKTILEVNYGTAKAFAAVINTNLPGGQVPAPEAGETFYVAYQTKPGANAGSDWRFLFSADAAKIAAGYQNNTSIAQNAKITLTFNKGTAVVKSLSYKLSDLDLIHQVEVDGEYWLPAEGCALFGFIIRDVPTYAWSGCSVKITNGSDVVFESSKVKSIEETVALGGYNWIQGEENIHAGVSEDLTQSDRPGNNEGAWRFFDKTEVKAGIPQGNNKGSVIVTWNYASAKTVSLYALYTGNDSTSGTNRNPLGWTLYGSNDGTEFTAIDVVTNPTFPGEGGWVTYFEVEAPASYQYYKIEFTTNSGAYFQLAEIKMFETATKATYNFDDTIVGAKNYAVQNLNCWGDGVIENFFDGNAGTKLGGGTVNGLVTVTWEYDAPVTAAGYGITTANDSTRFGRNPKGWTLYGSKDGAEWVVLDENSTSSLFSNELMIFGIATPDAYQYYKIEFKVGGAFQMADIFLASGNVKTGVQVEDEGTLPETDWEDIG